MSDRDRKSARKWQAAALRSIAVVGAMIVALGLFELSWPYEVAIILLVMFIAFSFSGIWGSSRDSTTK